MTIADYDRLPSKRMAVGGGEMFTVDVGHGPAVVLVHGSPVSSLEFRATIAWLLPGFRIVAPDLLTFGQSSGPLEGADFTQQVAALRDLIDALELDRFHLVVTDWGGPIGLGAAARNPVQVDRLVLLNTPVRPGFRTPWYWRPMTAPGLGELAIVRANLFSRGLPLMLRAARRDRQLRHRYARALKRVATRRTMLKLERFQGYDAECQVIREALPQMQGPKKIIWGIPDLTLPREAQRLSAVLPDARLVCLRGAGHFLTEDAPDRVGQEIRAFLVDDQSHSRTGQH
jgi:haloalkane dehalogenase